MIRPPYAFDKSIVRPADDPVDTVFDQLRCAEPPPGMERRILDALHQRALEPSRSAWHGALPFHLATPVPSRIVRRFAFGVALTAMLAVVLALPGFHRHPHASTSATHIPPLASTPPTPHSGNVAQIVPAPQVPRRLPRKTRLEDASVSSPDSLALSELRAPSMPAPPLPLTPQEKLLLRVASKGDPEPETVLNGELRAKQQAEQEADFYRFFGKPETPAAPESE